MADLERIKGSNGSGEAVRAVVQSLRLSGSSTLDVDSTTNWPAKFIGLYGTPDGNGSVIPSSVRVFYGEVSGSDINITNFAAGYTDNGNSVGDIVVLKPTTAWADEIADFLGVSHNVDGSLNTAAVLESLGIGGTPTPDWAILQYAPNTVTYNGNRSYDLVFNGTDLTTAINPGTRIRTTRTVAAPTQSTSLNGINQHWVKTSPNKMTFTDDFTAMAWITPDKYQHGGIISRFGTSGWMLRLDSSGRVEIYADNGSVSRAFKSYQSVQLNRRVHVAGTLDMSADVGLIYIDGVSVPVENSGTSGTALVQNGNYSIGSWNGGNFFSGKIAQAAVFNAVLSASTIRNYISQGLVGNEPNIVSAHSFNGVATDLNTTTPNDLTAMNSATATNADSPFGGQASGLIDGLLDYGIVQAASFSTNTTLTVQVPEGCTIPTSGGVSAVSYSGVKAPYGMPVADEKWQISNHQRARGATGPFANGAFSNPRGWGLSIPTGSWTGSYASLTYGARSTAGPITVTLKLSPNSSSQTGAIEESATCTYMYIAAGSDNAATVSRIFPISVTTMTPYYLVYNNQSGVTLTDSGNLNDFNTPSLTLTNAYL